MPDTILDKIKAYKIEEIQKKKKLRPVQSLLKNVDSIEVKESFKKALSNSKSKYALIAEVKKASPSKGLLCSNYVPGEIAKAYEHGGAACISVLTDGPSFMGNENDLISVKSATTLPILRKDFIFDEYQIIESKAIGADCILLILSALEPKHAKCLEECALDLGLEVLIETHNQLEVDIANSMKSPLVGINNRNLHTFITDRNVTNKLAKGLEKNKFLISESGIFTRNHLKELSNAGAKAFLIGEALMRSKDIATDLNQLIGHF